MDKLLIICGPTATGKTLLGLSLAKKLRGEILSVDSRQVYKKLTIGTGKDIPDGSVWKEDHWVTENGISIWGYDIVDPEEEINAAAFYYYAKKVINDIYKRGNLPILVGGTGLYISAIVDGIETLGVPQDKNLRLSLESKSAEELFEILAPLDPLKAASLNSSDKKNPRRLIRAIEIATNSKSKVTFKAFYDPLFVGLTAPIDILKIKVEKRARNRLREGLLKEIEDLISQKVDWDCQAMTSLGYKEWKDCFINKKSKTEAFDEWVLNEKKYLKRQITWFKKDKRINWFNVMEPNWKKDVEALVKKWYK
jgi:tRNA dimethylallyltransferase